MFKKIALAVALVAASSFAAWDYYKVPEAGYAQLKVTGKYDTDSPWSGFGMNASARFVVIPNLELSLMHLGFAYEENDNSDGSGIADFTIGARYAILPIVNIFIDMNMPIGDADEGSYIGSDTWGFFFGGQFTSDQFAKNLNVGAEVGTYWGFEHDGEEPGLLLTSAIEARYYIERFRLTPIAGTEFKYKLTHDKKKYTITNEATNRTYTETRKENQGDSQFNLWGGANYKINENMSVEGLFKFRSGDQSIDGDAFGLIANFYLSF